MNRHRMRRWGWMIPFLIVAITAVVGFIVMSLWNGLMPDLFALKPITFWQALGLLILSRFFFGGFHGRRGGSWRGRMRERWEHMTPEEREKFRGAMRDRCRGYEPPSPPPPSPTPTATA